jgi:hypothetical protein
MTPCMNFTPALMILGFFQLVWVGCVALLTHGIQP